MRWEWWEKDMSSRGILQKNTSSRNISRKYCTLHSHWRYDTIHYLPRKSGLYWFMPALAKSNVGSPTGTHGDEGQKVWPCCFTKNSIKVDRTLSMGHSCCFFFWSSDDDDMIIRCLCCCSVSLWKETMIMNEWGDRETLMTATVTATHVCGEVDEDEQKKRKQKTGLQVCITSMHGFTWIRKKWTQFQKSFETKNT